MLKARGKFRLPVADARITTEFYPSIPLAARLGRPGDRASDKTSILFLMQYVYPGCSCYLATLGSHLVLKLTSLELSGSPNRYIYSSQTAVPSFKLPLRAFIVVCPTP